MSNTAFSINVVDNYGHHEKGIGDIVGGTMLDGTPLRVGARFDLSEVSKLDVLGYKSIYNYDVQPLIRDLAAKGLYLAVNYDGVQLENSRLGISGAGGILQRHSTRDGIPREQYAAPKGLRAKARAALARLTRS